MENASKALLIAGAILIAILLIAIGMMVFNSANGVVDTSKKNMSQQEKTAFNKQFTIYEGIQSGSTTRALYDLVMNNNNDDDNPKITVNTRNQNAGYMESYLAGPDDVPIVNSAQYNIIVHIDNSGIVNNVEVNRKLN